MIVLRTGYTAVVDYLFFSVKLMASSLFNRRIPSVLWKRRGLETNTQSQSSHSVTPAIRQHP